MIHNRYTTLFPATNPVPTIHGLESPLTLPGAHTVTWNASYFGGENISFAWSINGESLAASNVEKYQYEDNSASFQTLLGSNFTRHHDQLNLTCSLIVKDGVLGSYEKQTSALVNLYCKCSWSLNHKGISWIKCVMLIPEISMRILVERIICKIVIHTVIRR